MGSFVSLDVELDQWECRWEQKDARDEAEFDCKVGPIRIHMVTDPYKTDYDREKG